MKSDIKSITESAAKFWFEASQFLENLCLLAEAISNQLAKEGYSPISYSYGLKFAAFDRGDTRLVYDRMKNHWYGRFLICDSNGASNNDFYGYGISFDVNNPSSAVKTWIPLIYFFKGKTRGVEWKDWDFSRILFSPSNVLSQIKFQNSALVNLDVGDLKEIDSVRAVFYPLGAIQTMEDIGMIVKPTVEALRQNNADCLSEEVKSVVFFYEKWMKNI